MDRSGWMSPIPPTPSLDDRVVVPFRRPDPLTPIAPIAQVAARIPRAERHARKRRRAQLRRGTRRAA
jgi:hypothetical protein